MSILETDVNQTYPKLLVIDDEPAVRNLTQAILKRALYHVQTCDSAEEALKLLKKEHFDCIITDAIMPTTNGYDFTKAIRKEPSLSEIPVLMLTRKRQRTDVEEALAAGVNHYILKPIDEPLLLDKINLCLTRSESRHQIIKCPILGELAESEISFTSQLTSISESSLTVLTHIQLPKNFKIKLRAHFFEKINMSPPLIKLITCKRLSDSDLQTEPTYEAIFSLMGVPESDLRKIRVWIQREEIRRRK